LNTEAYYALKTDGSVDYINTWSIKRNLLGIRFVSPETQDFIYDLIYTREYKRWQFTGVLGYFSPGDLEQINYNAPKDALWFCPQILFTLN